MDYRHLHLVAEICRHGSFGRAARALDISQPALSKNIARLEDQLSVKLFLRGNGKTQPTLFALHILARSRQMLGDAEKIAIEVRQMATGETGRVRFGAEPISRFGFLPSLVDDVLQRFPKLQLEITDRPATQILQSLLEREIDIGVTNADCAVLPADITAFRLFESPIVAVARPAHPIFSKTASQNPNDYPVVLLDDDGSAPASRAGSVTGPVDIVKEIVTRTDAITRGPAFLFRQDFALDRLRPFSERPGETYVCHMLVASGALHSAVIGQIVFFAQTNAAMLGPPKKTRKRR